MSGEKISLTPLAKDPQAMVFALLLQQISEHLRQLSETLDSMYMRDMVVRPLLTPPEPRNEL